MSIESMQATREIGRLSQLIAHQKLSDDKLQEIISDLDAIQSPGHRPQAFLLRCAVSQKFLDPEKRIKNIWTSFEYGLKLAQANQDPDLVLQLQVCITKLEEELINSGYQEKIQNLILQVNVLRN